MSTSNPQIKAILFDATGTLIELAAPVGETYAAAARAQGVELPAWRIEDAFRRVRARSEPKVHPELDDLEAMAAAERAEWRDRVRQTFQAVDSTLRFPDADGLAAQLFEHYADAAAWRLRPGVAETLARLDADGLRIGVVSNFDLRLSGILQGLGILDFMDCLMLPALCGARKPDPRIFEAALEALGLPAGSVVFVGDDPDEDLAGARAAGLTAIDVQDLGALEARLRGIGDPATLTR